MINVKKFLLLAMFAAITTEGNSQLWKLRRLELSAGAGTSHFMGDVGGYTHPENYKGFRDISIFNTGFVYNSNLRYRLTKFVSVRANISGGFFRSSDNWGSNIGRSYMSSTIFFEPVLMGEFYIFKNNMENRYLFIRGHRTTHYPLSDYFDAYVFGGIGGLNWDITPNANLAFKIKKADGFTLIIPGGIGISKSLPRNFKTGVELGGRYVLSDLPEGYSGLGSKKDVYYFLTVNLTWKVRIKESPTF
ncbi:MAG TPA: hypothetical protein VHO50_07450 [Bacteroidales bacterium]|nr:hypothetical protein [Bacteroidales bacterium]